jgi:DNA helicase HerA-like ATPase
MEIGIINDKKICMVPSMGNRHGLITGATGTGKTVTLKVLAESFSDIGVPVFMQDIKGDLTGFIEAGSESDKFKERMDLIGLSQTEFKTYPTTFFDIFGKKGHPIRTTVSDMGPLMLTRLLTLSDAQSAVLYAIFKLADEEGLLLLDFKDLSAIIDYVSNHSKELPSEYGTINKASIGAIKRKLLMLEEEGIEYFFGEPALDIKDLMVVDNLGRGMINVLESSKLAANPNLYATFLLWLLSELFEELEEVGDLDKPRLVFFFDEAHLIFKNMSKYLLEKFEQVVKLIRSKGVGIYFVTQNPLDIPESVLGQLGNRIQHALRAYTPKDQRAVKVAADTFRQNPSFDTAEVITKLAVGEALISFLDGDGIPGIVERAYILPPKSKIGPVKDAEALKIYIGMSCLGTKYNQVLDRPSAYEQLNDKVEGKESETKKKEAEATEKEAEATEKKVEATEKEVEVTEKKVETKETELEAKEKKASEESLLEAMFSSKTKKRSSRSDTAVERMVKSAASSIGTQVGRSLIRGILGSLSK